MINTDAPLNDGKFHIFGLYWTPNRIEWYLDGEKVSFQTRKQKYKMIKLFQVREVGTDGETDHLITHKIPLFMQLEAEVTDGNAIADSDISEGCVVDYARHFAIDNIQDCD